MGESLKFEVTKNQLSGEHQNDQDALMQDRIPDSDQAVNGGRKMVKKEYELWTSAFWDFRNEKGKQRKLMR